MRVGRSQSHIGMAAQPPTHARRRYRNPWSNGGHCSSAWLLTVTFAFFVLEAGLPSPPTAASRDRCTVQVVIQSVTGRRRPAGQLWGQASSSGRSGGKTERREDREREGREGAAPKSHRLTQRPECESEKQCVAAPRRPRQCGPASDAVPEPPVKAFRGASHCQQAIGPFACPVASMITLRLVGLLDETLAAEPQRCRWASAPTQKSVSSLCWLLAVSKADHWSLPSGKASAQASMAAGGL